MIEVYPGSTVITNIKLTLLINGKISSTFVLGFIAKPTFIFFSLHKVIT